jgi:hypothetical protein
MLKTILEDGHKWTQNAAFVDDRGALAVAATTPPLPDTWSPSRFRYFSQLLSDDGTPTWTTNMNVDWSVTPQEFYIPSNTDYDIRIMWIIIIIADTAVVHNNFGNVGALANGWGLKITEAWVDTSLIDAAKTWGQVIAQSWFANAYWDSATSFELSNWTWTEDAQTIYLPVSDLVPGGIRIGRGTKDKIISTVNDNVTGLTEFTVRVLWYRHYP